jgi:hypothetical protein
VVGLRYVHVDGLDPGSAINGPETLLLIIMVSISFSRDTREHLPQ